MNIRFLSNDLTALQSARRALGERMQTLAAAKETELTRLRNQVKAAQAAATATRSSEEDHRG